MALRRSSQEVCADPPNNGSELLLSLRRNALGSRHPQERDLRPINDQVTGTLRTVLRDVVHATAVGERTCPIDINVNAGESDGVADDHRACSALPASRSDRRSVLGFIVDQAEGVEGVPVKGHGSP
ncbi:hypothetical protein ACN6K4_000453 [Streptomyces hayashii]|uniref:hypothetical protein n=1 Tax=Streptomyces hayashii TaxID=2839966 RepID=UPI00403D0CFD